MNGPTRLAGSCNKNHALLYQTGVLSLRGALWALGRLLLMIFYLIMIFLSECLHLIN